VSLGPRRQGSRGGAGALSRSDHRTAQISSYQYPEELRADELLLRAPLEQDVDTIAPAFLDPAVGGEASLPPVDAETLRTMLRERLPELRARGLMAPYVIEDSRSGTILGGTNLHHFDPLRDVVEVGYWLFVDARGRGVATRAVGAMVDHALANGISRVEAHVRLGNTSSERVLERLGFEREGVKRRFLHHGGVRVDATLFALVAADA
jgi:RimJ/RimL family protein N-acetyltransferase